MGHFATLFDTLQNLVTGLGKAGVDSSTAVQYILNLIDRPSLENMYRGDWLARKIVDAPADDMTREWRSWQAEQSQIEKIEELEKKFAIQQKVKTWISRARLYGGSALVLGIDDGLDPSQPIDLDKCKKDCLKYVVVLNCFDLNPGPRIYNVLDEYFSRPQYYTVSMPMFEGGNTLPVVTKQPVRKSFSGNVVSLFSGGWKQEIQTQQPMGGTNIGVMAQIHPSRVIELAGNELPDWRLAPMGGGWGDSVLQTVVDDMQAFTTTTRSVSAMVSDGKLDVVKIPDMALNLTTPGYKNKLIERFALSTQTKSVISALLLDKEEEWERVNTQYGGLPMIIHEFITLISGAADIPVSRLFGTAQGQGLNGGSTAGGADDLRNYYDGCSSKQKNEIAPRLVTLDQVVIRSALGKEDPNIYYDWNPLWQMSDAEKSQIAYQKAQTTQIYSAIGIINSDALREGTVNQLVEDGTYPGLEDAIEEFGSEPEMDDETGGFIQPNGMPAPNMAQMATQEAETNKLALEQKKTAAKDYDPDQERDDHGRWTAGGGSSLGPSGSTPGSAPGSTPSTSSTPRSAAKMSAEAPQQQMRAESTPQMTASLDPGGFAHSVATGIGAAIDRMWGRWAYLGKQIGQYPDAPSTDKVVKKLVNEQHSLIRDIHAARLVENGGEGTDKQSKVMRDVVVVGAGPAGMSAGIYGASEGLNTLIAEGSTKAGGQAGKSSLIENFMGFPVGLSGNKLATEGVQQVERLGGEVQTRKQAVGLDFNKETGIKTVRFADGTSVQTRVVIIAGGQQFKPFEVPGADSPDVTYGDSVKLKARIGSGDAVVVGGANSAGQAAMDLANTSRHVTILARSGVDDMSSYLLRKVEANPRITVKKGEVAEFHKDPAGRMTGATLKDGTVLPVKGAVIAIGSKPTTDWTGVDRDEKGFITTGGPGRSGLETSIPGVFAAGDVRTGDNNEKRVAVASGEGAISIAQAHRYIGKMPKSDKPRIVKDAKFAYKPGKDAATLWLKRMQQFDEEEFPYPYYLELED